MANTYIFTGPDKFSVNGGNEIKVASGRIAFEVISATVKYHMGAYTGIITPASDTVIINGTTFSGTASQLKTALDAGMEETIEGTTGTFTSQDSKTITVVRGLITSIV